tara:strand:- start:54097 stop:54831 length:735 start_codon:yes stop_codon:yes gene_type:complete
MTDTQTQSRIDIRPFASLGHADHGWLDARHHFSFAHYHDPARMGWGALRVWNDDAIAAGAGFPPHPHADMEIITYVRQGVITHKDSMGNEGRTEAGDVQVMSAGMGVTHSEYNMESEETRLFQIWIIPDARGGEPGWGARRFPHEAESDETGAGQWTVFASGMNGDAGALPIRADARVLGARVMAGSSIDYSVGEGRHGYLVPATGAVEIDGERVDARDGVAMRGGDYVITVLEDAELVLVDSR